MTILSETTKNVMDSTGGKLMITAAILLIILAVIAINNAKLVVMIVFTIASAICFIVGLTIGSKPHRQIKAIISDEYSVVDLYDRYDVIERDGAIWVLIEKEPIAKESEE